MFGKTMIVLSAIVVLGAASAALAAGSYRNPSDRHHGPVVQRQISVNTEAAYVGRKTVHQPKIFTSAKTRGNYAEFRAAPAAVSDLRNYGLSAPAGR